MHLLNNTTRRLEPLVNKTLLRLRPQNVHIFLALLLVSLCNVGKATLIPITGRFTVPLAGVPVKVKQQGGSWNDAVTATFTAFSRYDGMCWVKAPGVWQGEGEIDCGDVRRISNNRSDNRQSYSDRGRQSPQSSHSGYSGQSNASTMSSRARPAQLTTRDRYLRTAGFPTEDDYQSYGGQGQQCEARSRSDGMESYIPAGFDDSLICKYCDVQGKGQNPGKCYVRNANGTKGHHWVSEKVWHELYGRRRLAEDKLHRRQLVALKTRASTN